MRHSGTRLTMQDTRPAPPRPSPVPKLPKEAYCTMRPLATLTHPTTPRARAPTHLAKLESMPLLSVAR
jgi:hypothetical protein